MISIIICVLIIIGVCFFFKFSKKYDNTDLIFGIFICIILMFPTLIFGGIFAAQPESYEDYPVYGYNEILYYENNNGIKEINTLSIKNHYADPKVKEVCLRETTYEKLYWLKANTYDLIIPVEDVEQLK